MTTPELIPATELPSKRPDAVSVLVRRQDNSFFIGTGEVTLHVSKMADSPNGTPQVGSSYAGSVVEVVVTTNTQIYRDDTFQNMQSMPSTSVKLQQKVGSGSVDEIDQNSMINAWGKKTGNRLVADVLLYNNPRMGVK